jgi:hypothetical protein
LRFAVRAAPFGNRQNAQDANLPFERDGQYVARTHRFRGRFGTPSTRT